MNEEIFEELNVEPVDEKQISLATIYGKNEQQQDAKTNAELCTKWTKTTWKAFQETIRRGRNRSIEAYLVTDATADDDDDIFKEENRKIYVRRSRKNRL